MLGELGDELPIAVHRGHRHRGRETQFGAFGEFGLGEADRVPPDQRLHRRQRRVGDDDEPAAVTVGADLTADRHPPAYRVLTGPQVGTVELCPGVEDDRSPVSVGGHRLGTRRRDHHPCTGRDVVDDGRPAAGHHRHPGESAAEFFRGAPRTGHQRPDRGPAASRTAERGFGAATPPAAQVAAVELERAVAGPAPHMLTAAGAGQRRDVAAPGHAEDHRCVRGERGPGGVERDGGDPCRAGLRIPGDLSVVVGDGLHARATRPDHLPVGDEIVRPARGHQCLRLRRAGETTDHQGALLLMCAQHADLTGMRVGRTGFGETVVTVVPDHHQPQLGDGGKDRTAGAQDHRRGAPTHGEPPPVACRGTQPGGQRHTPVTEERFTRRRHPIEVPLIGYDDDRAPARGHHRRSQLGKAARPVLTGYRLPGGAGMGGAQGVQETVGRPIRAPAGPVGRDDDARRRRGLLFLGAGVARRDREADDVAHGARIPVGDRPAQRGQFGTEDGFGGDHAIEPAEFARMLTLVDAVEQDSVDEASGEADAHPHTRQCRRILLGVNEIVEGSIEVGQSEQRQHLRHRPRGGRNTGTLAADRLRGPRGGPRRRRRGVGQRPAAARNFSARSVRSHGRSMSVRPK